MKKMKICKHKWHFMEKDYDGRGLVYKYTESFGYHIDHVEPITKTFAIFVCEHCGKLKKVEIENKEVNYVTTS